MKLIFALALLTFGLSSRARAWQIDQLTYELRSPIGASFVKPGQLNDAQNPSLKILYGGNFGADAIVDLDSFGVGLRFDSVSAVRADGSTKDGDAIEVASHVFSLLGRKRWDIDTRRYVGVNGTVAVYAPSYVNTHAANGNWVQYRTNDLGSFSIGGEGGWYWDPFLVAAEIGYQSLVLRNLATDQGAHLKDAAGTHINVDMSGPYLKFILGLRFNKFWFEGP